jgi:hypothetical protein
MAITIERPAPVESSRTPGRRGLVAVLAVVVVVVVGFVVWAMTSGGDGEKTSIERVQDLVAAMRDDDVDKVTELLGDQEPHNALMWSMGLDAEPTFSECSSTAYGVEADRVTCAVTFGEDYFYSRVLGETLTCTFSAFLVDDVVLVRLGTPLGETPRGVVDVEAAFQSWVRENRPELDDLPMYIWQEYQLGGDAHASGELRIELLDEFMASRQ